MLFAAVERREYYEKDLTKDTSQLAKSAQRTEKKLGLFEFIK
jgi:hypothetical protein